MRVYGASPLYNYVELVFRSKRLFILSVVLATAIVSVLAATRSKSYTATGIVLLSQTQQAALGAIDVAEVGSIRYKLGILNFVMKDPGFIKDALRARNLDRDRNGNPLPEVEFPLRSRSRFLAR